MAALIPLSVLIPVGLVVIILIVVAWILFTKNKRIEEKVVSERKRFALYKKHIETLENHLKNPQKDFKTLNQIARAFFKEYLHLSYSLTYLELASEFKKQKKPDYVKFCKLMSTTSYKKEKITSQDVKYLVDMFSRILDRY